LRVEPQPAYDPTIIEIERPFPDRKKRLPAAAFYDLDGTLLSTNLVHTFGFYARNDQGILRSVRRTAATFLGIPLFLVADLYSRKVFNDLFFKWYRNQSEDRLRFLAQDLFEEVIGPSIYPGTRELLDKSRSLGLRQVVVTGALDISIEPLLRHLGIEEYVANRLEFVDGIATGRLIPPVMASATKASWIRTYAEREGISLSHCFCYADSMSDLPMLSMVGHPTATNPDLRLRSTALRHDWPILSLK
jgi:HAD superfamily hydrolase (TIGR01490 family)